MAQGKEIIRPQVRTERFRLVRFIPEISDALASIQGKLSPQDAYEVLSRITEAAHMYGPSDPPNSNRRILELLYGELGNKPILKTRPKASLQRNRGLEPLYTTLALWERPHRKIIHAVYPELAMAITGDQELPYDEMPVEERMRFLDRQVMKNLFWDRGVVLALEARMQIPRAYSQAADQLESAWADILNSENIYAHLIATDGYNRLVQQRAHLGI